MSLQDISDRISKAERNAGRKSGEVKLIAVSKVQPDGRVVVRRGESEQEQTIAYNQVAAILRQEIAANSNLIAAIQTHPDAPYRHMVNTLDEVKLSGAERISLQELEN